MTILFLRSLYLLFLAPTGAQEVALSGPLVKEFLRSLSGISQESLSSLSAVSQKSLSSHSAVSQKSLGDPSEVILLEHKILRLVMDILRDTELFNI